MNAIDVSGSMALAFQNGDDTYHPVLPGTELELEHDQQTAITLNNLNAIVDAGNEIAMFLLGLGRVLVCFTNGNQYLANGFGYGHHGEEVHQFALFAAKHGFGKAKSLFADLSGLPPLHNDQMVRPSQRNQFERPIDSVIMEPPVTF